MGRPISQSAGNIKMSVDQDGWPRWIRFDRGAGHGFAMSYNEFCDLKYCVDRIAAQLPPEDEMVHP